MIEKFSQGRRKGEDEIFKRQISVSHKTTFQIKIVSRTRAATGGER